MSFSILFIILIVPIVVAIIAGMTAVNRGDRGERQGWRLAPMLAIGLALSVAMVVLVLFFGFASHDRSQGTPAGTAAMSLSPESAAAERVVVNQQLWDRLTESRIDLGEEPESEPPAKPEAKSHPDWVDKPPKRVGDIHRAVVASDPFSTADECFEQLEHRFPEEVERRLTKLVPSDQRSLVGGKSLETMGVSLDYIMREICREQFTEIVDSSVGAMKRVYVLMEFTPAVEKHLLDSWQKQLRSYRLTSVAQIAGCVLAVLALLYAALQFDTWTRGYYTQRLLWGVPAAIIAIAAVVMLTT